MVLLLLGRGINGYYSVKNNQPIDFKRRYFPRFNRHLAEYHTNVYGYRDIDYRRHGFVDCGFRCFGNNATGKLAADDARIRRNLK